MKCKGSSTGQRAGLFKALFKRFAVATLHTSESIPSCPRKPRLVCVCGKVLGWLGNKANCTAVIRVTCMTALL